VFLNSPSVLVNLGSKTKEQRLGALLNNRNFYLIVLEAGRLRSQSGPWCWVLVKTFQVADCQLLVPACGRVQREEASCLMTYKGSTLMTSNFNYSTSYCRYQSSLLIGFQCLTFWGNTASLVHNTKEIKLLLC